jgi:DNA-binding IclR family transcriptional regulator
LENNSNKAANPVHSVDRAISILQALARRGPMTVTDLAAELDIHKSTAFRLLATLEARGLVDQTSSRGKYQLGFGVVRLAERATGQRDLAVLARPVCEELAATVGETVNIVISDGSTITTIDQVMGSSAVTVVNWMGRRGSLHATASGKVFLAHMPEDRLQSFLSKPLERFTGNTVVDAGQLRGQLEEIRETGYGITYEEDEVGLAAMAAPIRGLDGEIVATVAISGPVFRINDTTFASLAENVLLAATKISVRNGYLKQG